MIREFCQKNNVFYLAFLCAELPTFEDDVLNYARKKYPDDFSLFSVSKSLYKFHEWLATVKKEMDRLDNKTVNLTLYS